MEENNTPTNKETLSVRIKPSQRKALDTIAEHLGASRNDFIENALQFYIDFNDWQIRKIQEAVTQADEGRRVSKQKMRATIDKLLR